MALAEVDAGREHQVACRANLCQAVLAAGQGRLAAAGEWVLNENGLPNVPGWAAFKTSSANLGRTWVRSCPTSGPLSG
jgi:hypothetical protein